MSNDTLRKWLVRIGLILLIVYIVESINTPIKIGQDKENPSFTSSP